MKKLSDTKLWELKFVECMKRVHQRNIELKAKKLMRKITAVKGGMVSRSKKHNVECTITLDDLRQLAFETYGTPCRYEPHRILTLENMVFDHIIPMSKGGPSTKENIQIISRFGNNLKGSLDDTNFKILLDWLETVPEDLKKDIKIRLAHGIH